MKPPASSVICSTLLAMVSSLSRRPTVPSPFFTLSRDRRHVLERVVEVVDGGADLVEVLAQLVAGRAHLGLALADERLDALGDLADVRERLLDVVAGAGPPVMPRRRSRSESTWCSSCSAAAELRSTPLCTLLAMSCSGPCVSLRTSCRIARSTGSVSFTCTRMSEVGHRLDDVRDLIAVLEQVVLDHLAGHRIGRLGGAGIDLEVELAEQRRRLLEDRRVRPQLRLGLDADGDARERALEAPVDDLRRC